MNEDFDTAVATLNSTLIDVGIAVGAGLVVWLVATVVLRPIVPRVRGGAPRGGRPRGPPGPPARA